MTVTSEFTGRWAGHVPPTSFEDYSERYAAFFKMRREGGVIELRLHTDDGPYVHNWAAHNAWNRVWQDVGNDPENQVLIITATGDTWFQGDPKATWGKPIVEEDPDYIFQQTFDGWKLIESFVNNLDIPTIAAVNGPGIHTEFAMLCDITLAVETADFMDPHFMAGSAPGDGQALALQALMGTKRAAYHIYGGKSIPARKALEFGIISDVVPREELLTTAWELAEYIMKRPRFSRWATHNILARPWKKLVAEDFGFHMSQQMLSTVAAKQLIPVPELIAEARRRQVWLCQVSRLPRTTAAPATAPWNRSAARPHPRTARQRGRDHRRRRLSSWTISHKSCSSTCCAPTPSNPVDRPAGWEHSWQPASAL